MLYPERIDSEEKLDSILTEPSTKLVELMKNLDGDIAIPGVAGKMGVSLAIQAVKAIRLSGVKKKVYGIARFSSSEAKEMLEQSGVTTIACDLLNRKAVSELPKVKNVIFMAGRKFGTEGSEPDTWAMNTLAPAFCAEHFTNSRMVVFSTGCVYPLRRVAEGGCTEDVPPEPIGEYSQSCLGRERIFEYYAKKSGIKLLLFRLNYSIALRYGVLCDIGKPVREDRPVDSSVGYFNAIWQGDATAAALLSLQLTNDPPEILNVTGPETVSVEYAARKMAEIMGKKAVFKGEPGDLGYLSNASKMVKLFGPPRMTIDELIQHQAEWLSCGGKVINKPTHFEVNNGKF